MSLITFKSNAEIDADAEAQRQQLLAAQKQRMYEQTIAGQIRRDWEQAKRAKQEPERKMLDSLRRRKGEYSADKLAEIRGTGGSEIYMQITATKCRAAAAWIRDVLMPTHEKPWGLDPTPVSEVPPAVQQAIMQELQIAAQQAQQQAAQQGQPGQPVDMRNLLDDAVEDMKTRANQAAKAAADVMEETIEDQLQEGGWIDALEQYIDDFVTFQAAVLKAPVLRRKSVLAWADGWQPVKNYEISPQVERVSPFDLYPSQDATTPDDAAFIFERARFCRSDLSAMRGVPGYNEQAIDEVLREYGQGGLKDWLWTDAERAQIEGRGHEWLSSDATIDGLIYYGSAMGLSLLQWGVPAEQIDPLEEYQIEAILIGRHVVRLVLHNDPLERRPYGVSSFQTVPGAFWGQSIPELMADLQDTCNATARALINNLAIASGPMVEVNYDRLAPGEDGTDLHPWKVFQTKSSTQSGNSPAIHFYQVSSHAAELMGVYEQFERKADEVTNIPRYMYGSERVGGAGSTASGLSMLMESANKGIKAAIGHIDRGTIRRVIEAFWIYNMLYNPNRNLKGDCKVVARGSSAMLMRERTQMMRREFLQATANPLDMQLVGNKNRARLLSTIAKQLDINGWDDLEQLVEQAGQGSAQDAQLAQMMQQLQQQDLQSQIAERNAKAQKLMSEAQTQPVEAQKLMAEIKLLLAQLQELQGVPVPPSQDHTLQHPSLTGAEGDAQTRTSSPARAGASVPITGLAGVPRVSAGGAGGYLPGAAPHPGYGDLAAIAGQGPVA